MTLRWSSTRQSGILGMMLWPLLLTLPAVYMTAQPQGPAPTRIAGGLFEASAVAGVPAGGVLFTDDNNNTEIFWMALDAHGRQQGNAQRVSLGTTVVDPEAMTSDGTFFYLAGSQSKARGPEGDGLLRFRFDAGGRQITDVAAIRGLKAFLAANVRELAGINPKRGNDAELNIEGLAWDPDQSRLLVGLRAPIVDGHALVIPIKLRDPKGAFTAENLRVDDGGAIRLDLGGAGIRSLEHDATSGAFFVIAGAALNDETEDFRLLEWRRETGANRFTELARYPRTLKPEGITRAALSQATTRFLVFDTGRYAWLD